MKYSEFEKVMSPARMNSYLFACYGDTRKAMTLYRLNLRLSQELFTVISCFEVALRNAIDKHYTAVFGNHWLRSAASNDGIFDNSYCRIAADTINDIIRELGAAYTHPKLVAELGFGFWRYLFASRQYRIGRQSLLSIFPAKPQSTPGIQYNAGYVFNRLAKINELRNRIAHHEPICFIPGKAMTNTSDTRKRYVLILQLFRWMNIEEGKLLYGLDHVNNTLDKIDNLESQILTSEKMARNISFAKLN